jgi:hypothetical protein
MDCGAGEHVVEATSARVSGTNAHPDEWRDCCYRSLMVEARTRLSQEVARLGGNYAHVFDESIDPRHDHTTGETWLHGRFTYVLYSQSAKASIAGEQLLH